VPDSVGIALKNAGHEATFLRNSGLAIGSADPIVSVYAIESESILVALDGDMKKLAQSRGIGAGRFRSLNLLKLSCPEPTAANRIKEALSLIEHEWRIGEGSVRRLFVEIQPTVIRTVR
jgi:predicted nuclease of predicted toxin-antitoxin system